ncbi:V-set and immunoglobulin domain-containing protein 10 isoform X1 [Mixophyes fleayi]|uniref:V-set and immunoglobulin domain-containing protein 10 isoform X1 n=1 Tax=Mixophyes fleayi TaxID=3061075 RepID=UPI003F4E3BE3
MGPRVLHLVLSALIWGTSKALITSITGELGGQIVLRCSTVAENTTNVAWFMESPTQELIGCGSNSSSDPRFSRLNWSSLLITNLHMEDQGSYGCKDCSEIADSKPHIHLNITSGPNNMTFRISPTQTLPNGTLYISSGSSINFSCSSPSIPEPKMQVLFYQQDKKPELFHGVNGNLLNFSLLNVASDYQGNYTCSAENPLTGQMVNSTLQLLVYYTSAFPIQCNASNTEIPSELLLTCHWPGGYPSPMLEWQKDGEILSNGTSDTLVVSLNGSQYTDTFTCQGKDLINKDVRLKTCQVQLGSPVPQSHPMRTCLSGENVTLSCSVSGANPPASITWLRNLSNPDVEIQSGKKYQIVQNINISYLTIVNCSKDGDEGYYICKAENAVTTKDIYVWLTVNKRQNIVGLVSALLILFLLVVALITGTILYCDPQVYLKANPFRSGASEVLVLVDSEEEDEMEPVGNSVVNTDYSDTAKSIPPANNGNICKHQVLFHHPPDDISPDLISEVSEDTEGENAGDELWGS